MADDPKTIPADLSFEDALAQLEQIVSELESGQGVLEAEIGGNGLGVVGHGVSRIRRVAATLNHLGHGAERPFQKKSQPFCFGVRASSFSVARRQASRSITRWA